MANAPSEAGAAPAAASVEPQDGKPGFKHTSKRVLEELSETFVSGAHQVAVEGDFWFLATVRGLNKGAQRTKQAASKVGRYLLHESNKLRPSWLRKRTQRERIRDMLLREAKRAKLSGQEYEAFSEQIAILVDLVLQGSVKVSDIAFERDDRARQS